MLLDEGPMTAFQLLMLFSEDGGRRTVNVFSLLPDPRPQTRSRLVLSPHLVFSILVSPSLLISYSR